MANTLSAAFISTAMAGLFLVTGLLAQGSSVAWMSDKNWFPKKRFVWGWGLP
jgi:hypothetical protein